MNKLFSTSHEVSVLLSCYNGARWLGEAIESVLDQTFEDFEFIIVDDGSTDNSPKIIKSYAEQDERIVVISKRNTGLADSLNVGIHQARGEWIARLDADDICEPERLEKQLAKARANPDLVFVGSGLLVIDENGAEIKNFRYPANHGLLVRNLYTARKFPPHSSAFYRTAAVRSIGGYRPRIRRSQDWDLWLRLSEIGQFAALDETLVRIRKHREQISHSESGRMQVIDARVGITSYWIRRQGCPDPVDANDVRFEFFRSWIGSRLDQERCFEFFDYIAGLKSVIREAHKSPFKLFLAARYIISQPGFLIRLLRVRVFGEVVPRRIADEWIRKGNKAEVL